MMRLAAPFIPLTLCLALMAHTATATPCAPPDGGAQTVRALVGLLNQERAGQGLAALAPDPRLSAAAQAHACDSAARDRMDHVGSDGGTLPDRVRAQGYRFRDIAENVAAGQRDATEVVQAWMSSPGHRRNMMMSGITDIGVGLAMARDGTLHWVLNLGRPR